jgi:predicted transcriptional regulator
VRKKILIGQKQIKDGRWVTHEEAKKRLEKWLK